MRECGLAISSANPRLAASASSGSQLETRTFRFYSDLAIRIFPLARILVDSHAHQNVRSTAFESSFNISYTLFSATAFIQKAPYPNSVKVISEYFLQLSYDFVAEIPGLRLMLSQLLRFWNRSLGTWSQHEICRRASHLKEKRARVFIPWLLSCQLLVD